MSLNPFDFPIRVEDVAVRRRALQLLGENRVRLPTFAEIAAPQTAPVALRAGLIDVAPDGPHPYNLYRVNWFNDLRRKGQVSVPLCVELPEALTGVPARIVVALGTLFPMIRAHKVLAAYACLAPRLVSGRFDPTQTTRRVAVDRQLLPRRRRHLAHPRLPRGRRAARRHEPGALRLAGEMGERSRGHRPHAGQRGECQGNLRPLRRARARPGKRHRQPVQRVRQLSRPLALHRAGARDDLRVAAPRAPTACGSRASSRRAAPPARSRRATISRRSTAPRSRSSKPPSARPC